MEREREEEVVEEDVYEGGVECAFTLHSLHLLTLSLFSSLSFPDLSSSFLPALRAICFFLAPSVPEVLDPRLLTLTLTLDS